MEYNDENLLALHAQGLSYTQIAMHFPGVTRCAVGGRLKRIRDAGAGVVPPRRDRDRPTQDYASRSPPDPASYPRPQPPRITPSFGTLPAVATRPARYVEPTKAELREMLRQAVENTK